MVQAKGLFDRSATSGRSSSIRRRDNCRAFVCPGDDCPRPSMLRLCHMEGCTELFTSEPSLRRAAPGWNLMLGRRLSFQEPTMNRMNRVHHSAQERSTKQPVALLLVLTAVFLVLLGCGLIYYAMSGKGMQTSATTPFSPVSPFTPEASAQVPPLPEALPNSLQVQVIRNTP